jgi:hypothetical protein
MKSGMFWQTTSKYFKIVDNTSFALVQLCSCADFGDVYLYYQNHVKMVRSFQRPLEPPLSSKVAIFCLGQV